MAETLYEQSMGYGERLGPWVGSRILLGGGPELFGK